MSFAAAFPDADIPRPADAHPDAGRHEHPTSDPQPPVGTLPTGPHAEAEAAALQAARSGAELVGYATPDPHTGRLVRFGSILTPDQVGIIPAPLPSDRDPGENRRDADWPTPRPSYSNTSTGRVLAAIDDRIDDTLRQRNQALRTQLRGKTAELAQERSLRQDAQARLASERDAARTRIAELELTVAALGEKLAKAEKLLGVVGAAVKHAIGHDKTGGE
ncbi:MAG TPA: hypothetical protein VIN75_26035 [Burkholderiaceae bacterium]